MKFTEAQAKNYLVQGEVIPEEKQKEQFPLIVQNEDTPDDYEIDMDNVQWYQKTDQR